MALIESTYFTSSDRIEMKTYNIFFLKYWEIVDEIEEGWKMTYIFSSKCAATLSMYLARKARVWIKPSRS